MPELTLQNTLVILAVSLSGAAAGLWMAGWPAAVARLRAWVGATPGRAAWLVATVCALIWIGIFVVDGFPVRGDVKRFFQPQSRAAIAGEIFEPNFRSSYMPLFVYLIGTVDALFQNDLAIPLFFAACFAGSAPLLARLVRFAGENSHAVAAVVPASLLNGARGSWPLATSRTSSSFSCSRLKQCCCCCEAGTSKPECSSVPRCCVRRC